MTDDAKELDKIPLKIKGVRSEDDHWQVHFSPAELKKGITGKGNKCYLEIAGLVLLLRDVRNWLQAAFIGPNGRSNFRRANAGIFTVTFDGEPFQEIEGFFPYGRVPEDDAKDHTGTIHEKWDRWIRSNEYTKIQEDPNYRKNFGAHLAIFYKQDGASMRGRFKHCPENGRDPEYPVYQVEFV